MKRNSAFWVVALSVCVLFLQPCVVGAYCFTDLNGSYKQFQIGIPDASMNVIDSGWPMEQPGYLELIAGGGGNAIASYTIESEYGHSGPVELIVHAKGCLWAEVSSTMPGAGYAWASNSFIAEGSDPHYFEIVYSDYGPGKAEYYIDEVFRITVEIGRPYEFGYSMGNILYGYVNPGNSEEWINAASGWWGVSFTVTLPHEPVPEPASVVLFCSGFLMLALWKRKKAL